jgi:hypothetical protein
VYVGGEGNGWKGNNGVQAHTKGERMRKGNEDGGWSSDISNTQ